MKSGSIQIYHGGCEPWELDETCALDVAGRGEQSFENIAWYLGVTMERVRQIFEGAIRALAEDAPDYFDDAWDDHLEGVRRGGFLSTGRVSGFVIRGERFAKSDPRKGVCVVIMTKRAVYELTDETVRIKNQCSPLAARLLDILLISPSIKGGVRKLARSYEHETGRRVERDRLKGAIDELEEAGLVSVTWGSMGKRRVLVGIKLEITNSNTSMVTDRDHYSEHDEHMEAD